MIYILGNGESRKDIDIDSLKGYKVGCNGIYLHNKVDLICAMDKFWMDKISKEANTPLLSRKNNMSFQTVLQLYNNEKWTDTKCPYRGYCSGITALDYICSITEKHVPIYLLGFDFTYNGTTVNHIYKNTQFHPKETRPAQPANLFLLQCIDTIKRYPRHNIIYVNNDPCNRLPKQITVGQFKQKALLK